ncbi:MAG: response regulator [Patescibacteria group bacterium]|nr:response regulator [bacterium]MDZ4240909.1 response regulator [Patescibacteria group bacterium]
MENGKKYKILIVDDDKFLLNMYSMKFGKNGFDVSTAPGGTEALAQLRSGFNPDALLLDIIMPTIDGKELLRTVKKENLAPHAAVVMLTNQGGESDVSEAKTLGADGYIVKATTIPSEVVEEVLKIVKAKDR